MKLKNILFFGIVLLLFIASCYYDKEEVLYPELSNSCDTLNISYSSNVSKIMSSYCLGCHGTSVAASFGGNIKLQEYTDVKSNIDKVYGAVAHENGFSAMPKGGSQLDACKIKIIKKWKDAGAPNN